MSKKNETHVVFRTVRKTNVAILRQPFTVTEKYQSGNNKGNVKSRRVAQYCENHSSIYIDEQKKIEDEPIVTHQYFKKGDLLVDLNNITLLEALRKHEDNVANGGTFFKEYNASKEEVDRIKEMMKVDDLRSYIVKADDALAKTMGLFFLGNSSLRKSPDAIKIRLREKIEVDAILLDAIYKFSKETNHKQKTIAVISLTSNIVTLSGKTFSWTSSGENIFIAPQSNDAVKSFSNWLISDEQGREVYSALVDQIGKENKED